ncbi:MAG: inositol 2-dehydrogenase, partial [Clostridia bacterium]|nr:inositol 2-dehydrogenase [Clostridia bacterium]
MVATSNDTLSSAVIADENGVTGEKPLYFFLERYMESFGEEVRQFVAAVENDTDTPVGIHAATESVKVAKAALESAKTGKAVKV